MMHTILTTYPASNLEEAEHITARLVAAYLEVDEARARELIAADRAVRASLDIEARNTGKRPTKFFVRSTVILDMA